MEAGRTVARPPGPGQASALEARSGASTLPGLSIRPAALLGVLALGAAGCAFPPDDVHLAPLYSHHWLAAGGHVHEGLGGLVEVRKEEGPAPATEVAVRPL